MSDSLEFRLHKINLCISLFTLREHAHQAKIAGVAAVQPPAPKVLCADAKVFLIIAATLRRREQEIVPPATSGAIKPIQISYIFWGLKSETDLGPYVLTESTFRTVLVCKLRREYFDWPLPMMRQLQNSFPFYVLRFCHRRLNTFSRMQHAQIRF